MSDKMSFDELLSMEDPINDCICDLVFALIKERKKKRITQGQLSSFTGIPQSTISRLETFRTTPSLSVLIRLSNALNLDVRLSPREVTLNEN